MTTSTKYHRHAVTPSLEDQAYHSSIHEAGAGGDELHSISERIPDEGQNKWTYFLLGCAILVPWSSTSSSLPILFVLMSTQLWKMGRRIAYLDWPVPRSTRPSPRTGRAFSH